MKIKKIVDLNPSEGICDDCQEPHLLMPYGKDGAFICFDCGMKDEAECKRRMDALIDGADLITQNMRTYENRK